MSGSPVIFTSDTGTQPTNSYAQGYLSGATWSTTSTTFVDPTVSGSTTYTSRQSNGITVSAAASNKPGISFTPSSSSAVYLITVTYALQMGNSATGSVQLTDGTTIIAQGPGYQGNAVNGTTLTLSGIYVPGTISAVTVKMQLAAQNTFTLNLTQTNQAGPAITHEWTVVQIK